MTTFHYSESGTLAVCGQMANGNTHISSGVPAVIIGRADINQNVCPSCLAVAREKVAA